MQYGEWSGRGGKSGIALKEGAFVEHLTVLKYKGLTVLRQKGKDATRMLGQEERKKKKIW